MEVCVYFTWSGKSFFGTPIHPWKRKCVFARKIFEGNVDLETNSLHTFTLSLLSDAIPF